MLYLKQMISVQLSACLTGDASSTSLLWLLLYITSKRASPISFFQRQRSLWSIKSLKCIFKKRRWQTRTPSFSHSAELSIFLPTNVWIRASDGLNLIPLAFLKYWQHPNAIFYINLRVSGSTQGKGGKALLTYLDEQMNLRNPGKRCKGIIMCRSSTCWLRCCGGGKPGFC